MRREILEFLENIHEPPKMNEFLISILPKITLYGIRTLLIDMANEGLIWVENVPTLGGSNAGIPNDLTNTPIRGKINGPGIEQLAAYRSNESATIVNDSILSTNTSIQRLNDLSAENIRSQKNLTKTALWIAASSVFIALISAVISIWPKSDKPQVIKLPTTDSILKSTGQKMEVLTQRLQSLDSTVKAGKANSGKSN
jgi:hypothetical protein